MTLKTSIKDGRGTGNLTMVNNAGELIISGFGNNLSQFVLLNVNNQAFNFFHPRSGYNFMITSILFNVGGGATTMEIFEATSATSTTVSKQLINIVTATAGFFPINFSIGGFLQVTEGFFVNVTTTSQPNNMTIIGFYRPILE